MCIVIIILTIIVILKAKLHYLKIISELPSYGAKCFSTTLNSVSSSSPHLTTLIVLVFEV